MSQIESKEVAERKESSLSETAVDNAANEQAIRGLYETTGDTNTASSASRSSISSKLFWLITAIIFIVLVDLYLKIPNQRFGIALLGSGLLIAIVLQKGPKWQVAHLKDLKPEELFQQENEARKTLAQIIGGILVLAGLYYTQDSLRVTQEAGDKSRELTRQGQITDRFTKAVEQLGKSDIPGKESNIAIRLGGIYALERIANESKEDHWSIMELLATYVREYAHRDTTKDDTSDFGIKADIRAIVRVIGRRKTDDENDQQRLNLGSTDLRGTNFGGTNYNKAWFINANLNYAIFADAKLEEAEFLGTKLKNTVFTRADLRRAVFRLSNEDRTPIFEQTYLEGADLTEAKGLNCADIQDAIIDAETKLPIELKKCRNQ